jgi:hypothetical protein
MPDGSFLIGFNAINWGNWESEPMTFFPNGGVGVIRSTDGGCLRPAGLTRHSGRTMPRMRAGTARRG